MEARRWISKPLGKFLSRRLHTAFAKLQRLVWDDVVAVMAALCAFDHNLARTEEEKKAMSELDELIEMGAANLSDGRRTFIDLLMPFLGLCKISSGVVPMDIFTMERFAGMDNMHRSVLGGLPKVG
jgi:hypothetical protein